MQTNTLPPSNGTDTSLAAAHAIAGRVVADRSTVYQAIQRAGLSGLTCSEFMHATGADHAGSSARFWELSGGNDPDRYPILIAYLGEKRPAVNPDGSLKRIKARVYIALSTLPPDFAFLARRDEWARIRAKNPT